jgi:predicted acyltransferase
MRSSGTILLLADRRQNGTAKALKTAGYQLIMSFTADHAVALTVGNSVDAVIMDQEHIAVAESWSVAKSLKLVRANICVVLVTSGSLTAEEALSGVDAVVPEGDMPALLSTISNLLKIAP